MKSKMAEDSGETCRRMILAPNQAELELMFSMSLVYSAGAVSALTEPCDARIVFPDP
jgi:hypothetical protein